MSNSRSPRALVLLAAAALASAGASRAADSPRSKKEPDTCLLFVAQNISKGKGDFSLYQKISSRALTVKKGDWLRYEIYALSDQAFPAGGIDIHFTDGSLLRKLGGLAMEGVNISAQRILQAAQGRWHERVYNLGRWEGKTTDAWSIANEWDEEGTYVQFIDNVHVQHADGTRTVIYENGPPAENATFSKDGYSQEISLVVVPRADVAADKEKALKKSDALARFAPILDRQRIRQLASDFGNEMDAVEEIVRAEARPDLLPLVDRARAGRPDPETFAGSPEAYLKALQDTTHGLAHTHPLMLKYTGHLVGHAHIDLQWLWEWPQGIEVTRQTFVQAMKFMDQFPSFTFSQSSPTLYLAMEEHHPEVFKAIKKYVDRGQWELVGGRWSEGDTNIISEESHVRHFLYGQRYFREKFGRIATVGWEPDTFGHTFQMPQMLRLSGIDSYYFCRAGRKQPLFQWEAPDGSRVLAFDESQTGSWYGGDLTKREFKELADFHKRFGARDMIWVYGVSNHGGGPTLENIKQILDWQKKKHLPQARFSTARAFFDRLQAQNPTGVPVIRNDLNSVFEGVYTTHGNVKRKNRDAEALTVAAETAAALAAAHGYEYPRARFVKSWRDMTWNHHHDTLTGTAIHAAYKLTHQLYDEGIAAARAILADATRVLASQTDAKPGALFVLNTLGWRRDAVIEVAGAPQTSAQELVAVAPDGARAPVQRTAEGTLVFVAKGLPAFGHRVYRLEPATHPAAPLTCKPDAISTPRFDISINPRTGAIARLYDRTRKVDTLAGPAGELRVHWEPPHAMSAWTIGKISKVEPPLPAAAAEVIECGPVRARVRVARGWDKSTFAQEIVAYADGDLVETRLDADWQQIGNDKDGGPFLKAHFALPARFETVRASIPFGAINRPTDGSEFPALTWVDAGGVALLNDSKHGHSAQKNDLALSLIRASYSPDPEPDVGKHHIRWALVPHDGGADAARIAWRGREFNTPPATHWVDAAGSGALASEGSFLSLDGDPVIPTALKVAEDGADFVLRFYAPTIANAQVVVTTTLPVAAAETINFLEDRTADADLRLQSLRGFEIRTLRLKRPVSAAPASRRPSR